ncbi:MAG TPA: hypothetical protein VND64_22850 [Pirellulales bacterium]|nr:hypothetical protein [Pirellulales bacterium]
MNEFDQYQQRHDRGATPTDLYNRARADGLDPIAMIRMLRTVCGLSLAQAKEVIGASKVWDSKQDIKVGNRVFWEETNGDGLLLHEAVVTQVAGDQIELARHKAYHACEACPVEVRHLEPTRVPIGIFDRPLTDRLARLLAVALAPMNAACNSTEKAV